MSDPRVQRVQRVPRAPATHGPAPLLRRSLAGAAVAAALLVALLVAPGGPAQAQHDLTLAVLPSPHTAYIKMAETIPDRIAKATNGQVTITLNDSLVGGPQIAAAVRDGRVPMSSALHTYLAAEEPRMGIFNLPGLIDDMAEYAYVCEAFWCDDVKQIWLDRWNAVSLADGAWCTQQLFSKEPIRTIEDFRNKKLRVHNPQTATLMDALGAKPVPLALTEVMPALERGIIDGLFTSTCYGHGQEYWRLAPNVQNWGLGPINGWAILINKEAWEGLPEELRAKVQAEMGVFEKEALYGYYGFVREAMLDMESNGVTFWVAPDAEKARIFDSKYTQPVYDSWYKRAEEVGFDGPAYIEKVRQTLGKDLIR